MWAERNEVDRKRYVCVRPSTSPTANRRACLLGKEAVACTLYRLHTACIVLCNCAWPACSEFLPSEEFANESVDVRVMRVFWISPHHHHTPALAPLAAVRYVARRFLPYSNDRSAADERAAKTDEPLVLSVSCVPLCGIACRALFWSMCRTRPKFPSCCRSQYQHDEREIRPP